jgi:hypothetical protein
VVGGLCASTLVTLVLIPVTYVAATGVAAGAREGRWRTLVARREPERAPAATTS